MYQFNIMETLMADIRRDSDDKAITHARAKNLLKLVQKLIKDTQPGPGEFKWTQAARKALTKSADSRKGNPALIVARDANEVWHTNGYYMVKGEPSKRFEPYELQELPMSSVKGIINPNGCDDVEILGSKTVSDLDCVEFNNGTTVQRIFLSYVTATIGGEVTYKNAGKLYPVYVLKDGKVMGMIMPYNCN